jgi:hypothetical protein
MGGFIQSREALESMGEPFYEIEYAFNVNEPKYTTEDIEAALSGTWIAPNSTVIGFRFSDGQFEKIYSSASLYGQYSINLEESSIELKITDADGVFGTVLDTMKFPSGSYAVEKLTFTFRDGILALTDSEGTELEKR